VVKRIPCKIIKSITLTEPKNSFDVSDRRAEDRKRFGSGRYQKILAGMSPKENYAGWLLDFYM